MDRLSQLFEQDFKARLEKLEDSRTADAMRYSALAGGKRLRPRFLLETLQAYSVNPEIGLPAASAIEMIQTYSLIHDDLPAMDNDDLRRGKPTCHKAFDEATAILAGDALLTQAFEEAAKTEAEPSVVINILSEIAKASGVSGMVRGQDLDMALENHPTEDPLEILNMEALKTGCLLSLPFVCAALLANHPEHVETWKEAGRSLGLAFQIQDDILDVTESADQLGKSNSDQANGKKTLVSLLGLDRAREMERDYSRHAQDLISSLELNDDELLTLVESLSSRTK